MEKLLEKEEGFLKQIEKAADDLHEEIQSLDKRKELDDKNKDFLKEEAMTLRNSLKNVHQIHRRFYTALRQAIVFDKLK